MFGRRPEPAGSRDRSAPVARRHVVLLRGQPLAGLHLLRGCDRPACRPGCRGSASGGDALHGPWAPGERHPRRMNVQRIPFGRGELFRTRLFTAAEALRIAALVDTVPEGLRRSPGRRLAEGGMTTIGEPLYVNRHQLDYYTRCAREDNRRLYRHFSDAYERLAGFFEQRYRVPVVFAEELAMPG